MLTGFHHRNHYHWLLRKQTPPTTVSNSAQRRNLFSNTAASANSLLAICQVPSSVPQSPRTKKHLYFTLSKDPYTLGSDRPSSIPRVIPTSPDGARIALSAKIRPQGCLLPSHPAIRYPVPVRIQIWAHTSTPTHPHLAQLAAQCQATETSAREAMLVETQVLRVSSILTWWPRRSILASTRLSSSASPSRSQRRTTPSPKRGMATVMMTGRFLLFSISPRQFILLSNLQLRRRRRGWL